MSPTARVVAVVPPEAGEGDEPVLAAARALGDVLGASSTVLRPGTGSSPEDVLEALAGDDVAAAAMGLREDDPVLWRVVTRTHVPLLVVPHDTARTMGSIRRVVLPLDGSPATAAAVLPMARLLLAAGADVEALHVFAPATAPAFWDHAGHSHVAFTEEFLRRHQLDGVRLDLRRGRPVVEVLSTVDRSGADLVLLGWAQDLTAGHAAIVRQALLSATVPVLLVGAGPGPLPGPEAGPSALPPPPG